MKLLKRWEEVPPYTNLASYIALLVIQSVAKYMQSYKYMQRLFGRVFPPILKQLS